MGAGASSRRETDDAARTSPATLQWQDATKLFAEIDADGDGTISSAELASVLEAHGYSPEVSATLTKELDTDTDGVISFDEWRSRFYGSSFCSVKQPPGEDFGDLKPSPESGCAIEETAMRGITPEQLKLVKAHIQRRCSAEAWLTWAGTKLAPKKVSLYEAARYVIKPATYLKQCSFVELIATGEQEPLYFVSHWWGEPVFDFIQCINQHSIDRKLGKTAPYWVMPAHAPTTSRTCVLTPDVSPWLAGLCVRQQPMEAGRGNRGRPRGDVVPQGDGALARDRDGARPGRRDLQASVVLLRDIQIAARRGRWRGAQGL